jgi:hypothetical protein
MNLPQPRNGRTGPPASDFETSTGKKAQPKVRRVPGMGQGKGTETRSAFVEKAESSHVGMLPHHQCGFRADGQNGHEKPLLGHEHG